MLRTKSDEAGLRRRLLQALQARCLQSLPGVAAQVENSVVAFFNRSERVVNADGPSQTGEERISGSRNVKAVRSGLPTEPTIVFVDLDAAPSDERRLREFERLGRDE